MPSTVTMGGTSTDRIFLDTDFTRKFHVKDIDTDATGATAKDISGWTLLLDIRRQPTSAAALLTASLSVAGTFNSVASTNAQRATWTCADTDITTAIFGTNGGTFAYSVKRTNAGGELIIQEGTIVIERATQAG